MLSPTIEYLRSVSPSIIMYLWCSAHNVTVINASAWGDYHGIALKVPNVHVIYYTRMLITGVIGHAGALP